MQLTKQERWFSYVMCYCVMMALPREMNFLVQWITGVTVVTMLEIIFQIHRWRGGPGC
jgi:hypothetical protein